MVDHQINQYKIQLRKNAKLIIIAFSACFGIMLGSQQYINHLKSDYDSLINISGRQRMLSQKLAYLKSDQSKLTEFKKNLELFKSSQQYLILMASLDQKSFYTKSVTPIWENYIQILESQTVNLENLYQASQATLFVLNQAVSRFEDESDKYDKIHLAANILLTLIGFLLIGFLHFFILKPQQKSLIQGLRSYSDQKKKADESSKIKSAFIANMTHELRTPMNGVLGFSQLLKDTSLDPEQQNYLGSLDKASHSLLDIINDILDFSKLESGNISIVSQSIDHNTLTNEVVSLLHPRAVQKKIELKYEIDENLPRYIVLDPLRLKQILMNLMTNAIKFTKVGSVTLKVKKQNDSLLFQVIDTGIGISQDQIQTIFQEFQQVENTYVKTQEGAGLGLTLVKKFVDLMHGHIEVDSEVGIGTTFSVTIPLEEGNAPKNKPIEVVSELNADIGKILVVEDNKMNQLVIGGILSKLQLDYEFANNGLEAVSLTRTHTYDLILMDISMPEMNGFDATEKIRQFNKQIPIFCLSANVFNNDRERAINSGMNEFLDKPIKKEKLISLLNRYFNTKAA